MNDKSQLLQAIPQICKRLFGIDFELLETIFVKVQNQNDIYLQKDPLSNRGIDGEFSILLFNPLNDHKSIKSFTITVQKKHLVKVQLIINQRDIAIIHCQLE